MNKHHDGTMYAEAHPYQTLEAEAQYAETRCTCGHEKDIHEESFGYIKGCWECTCEEFRQREKSSKKYKTKERRTETKITAIAKGYFVRSRK